MSSMLMKVDEAYKNRVKQALYRAMKKWKELFVKDPTTYDAYMSVEEILEKYSNGEYDKDNLIAHMTANAIVANEIIKVTAPKKQKSRPKQKS